MQLAEFGDLAEAMVFELIHYSCILHRLSCKVTGYKTQKMFHSISDYDSAIFGGEHVNSMLDLLLKRLDDLQSKTTDLLIRYSSMKPVNEPGDSLFFIGPSNFWKELPTDGKTLQVQLLPDFDKFAELTKILTQTLPSSPRQELDEELREIREFIDQDNTTWKDSPNNAVEALENSCAKIKSLLSHYFGSKSTQVFAIPDTNALILNPTLETWKFDGIKLFTLVLTPAVLSELDQLKINHKNEEVRKKAKVLANKFFDYASRGELSKGLTMVNNKIMVKSVATEPKMNQSLSWFEPTNADDRFLASTIEIMRDFGKRNLIRFGPRILSRSFCGCISF